MQIFVNSYQFMLILASQSEEVPNQVPEKVCLHYKVFSHLNQFLPPLYGQHPEASEMLPHSATIFQEWTNVCKIHFSNDFLDTRNYLKLHSL